jgi:PadR family transcriptional regulator, regulatory protein PadR
MAYSMKTLAVLAAMLEDQTGKHFGYNLMQKTKTLSGTLYPMLARLENDGWLTSEVEDVDPRVAARKPRRYYTLTGLGIRKANEALNTARSQLTPSFIGCI